MKGQGLLFLYEYLGPLGVLFLLLLGRLSLGLVGTNLSYS